MLDILFAVLGLVLGVLVLCGVFWLATAPRKGHKSWLAPPSGKIHEPGEYGGG